VTEGLKKLKRQFEENPMQVALTVAVVLQCSGYFLNSVTRARLSRGRKR
jgi:hypothetical protein